MTKKVRSLASIISVQKKREKCKKSKTIQIRVYSFKHKRPVKDVYPDSNGKKRFFLIDAVILSLTLFYMFLLRHTLSANAIQATL